MAGEFDFGIEAAAEPQVYFQTLPNPTRQQDQVVRVTPNAKYKSGSVRFQTQFTARTNSASKVPVEQFLLNLTEAFLEWRKYPVNLKLGVNTHNWGYMDGFSPLDVVNTKVYLDLLNSEKRGSPGLDITYEADTWSFQGLYIPVQQLPVMPATDSRWLPRFFLIDTALDDITLQLPKEFDYIYGSEEIFDQALANNFGFRFQKRFSKADLGLVYFEGVAQAPQFGIEVTGSLIDANTILVDSDVRLTPLFHRQRVSGVQLAYTISDIILKIESAYTEAITNNSEIPTWTYQNALGLEIPFYIGSRTLNVLVQGYYGDSDIGKDNLLSSSTRIFDESAALGFRYGIDSHTSILATGVYDFSTDSYFAHAQFNKGIGKYAEVMLAYDFFAGEETTLLGSFNRNERVTFRLAFRY